MIEQQGRVVHSNENGVAVRVGTSPDCPVCAAGKGCGAGIFSQLLPRHPLVVTVPNVIGAQPGQLVSLGISEHAYLRVLLRGYLMPLLAALIGAATGYFVASLLHSGAAMTDAISVVGGVVFFYCLLYFSRMEETDLQRRVNLQLVRVVLEPSPGSNCQSGGAKAD